MYTCKYPHLFSQIKLGNTVFRNRYFSAPMGYPYVSPNNHPLEETIAFYERKAIGGAATVTIGSAVTDSKRGCSGAGNLHLDDPGALPPIYRLTSAINRHGAVPAIELCHNGANSYYSAKCGNQIYGVVDGLNALGQFVPAMPEEIIEETIEGYADAAAYAKFCGFGMVIIHAGHGWFLNQFLDPKVNNRKDQWGGSLENRCRLPLAIAERIRKKCGNGFPIDIRISGSMCYDGGYDIDEGVAIAKQLDGKVDLIHVSAGSHEVPEVFTVTHPSMFLPDGVNVVYAAEIKKHVKTHVATVGALGDPELMEEIIASGKADVVLTARATLADPDLPKKARAGKADEIRPCMRCFQCFASVAAKRQETCAVNPEIGFEQECRHELPSSDQKTVLVVGGGVSGMQAALTASERGHRVILCEKSDRLGGTLRCEEKVPFKKHLSDYLDYQARMISRKPIDIRMGTVVTPEFAKAVGADVIIAALGARPMVPKIPGIDSKNVLGAEEAYLNPEKTGEKVIILGGGLVGVELGIFLTGLGRKVTVIEMMDVLTYGDNLIHGLALNNEIKTCGIQVVTATRALEINDQGVIGEYVGNAYTLPPSKTAQSGGLQSNSFGRIVKADSVEGSRKLYEGDTVIYAIGQQPLQAEAAALSLCAPEFYQIGDCLTPKNIQHATSMAFTIARDI
ncbi:FAD-dependent oxidoreductase [Dehalobacter sp. DCM]|uniref:FAD-dependent oxidoreductase n=1 Tax=Dehalobacter sp. DCM TaxID=2907827 RepID=UPI0030815449|nr:FAD-dependent oxidoreductase [Dehalobacter sp. DCM]